MLLTFLLFAVMLTLYQTRIIKVTQRFRSVLTTAIAAISSHLSASSLQQSYATALGVSTNYFSCMQTAIDPNNGFTFFG
jgi:uncharacterized YccA/Bax inhibitor family protein